MSVLPGGGIARKTSRHKDRSMERWIDGGFRHHKVLMSQRSDPEGLLEDHWLSKTPQSDTRFVMTGSLVRSIAVHSTLAAVWLP